MAEAKPALWIYNRISGEHDGGDQCNGITEEACAVAPRNFVRQLAASICSKIGDVLSKPGVILTWLLTALGAPAAAIGVLAPLREAGSLLPQLWVGAWLRRKRIRKYTWVAGSILQGMAVLGMAGVASILEGPAAGWSLVGFLAMFSLARGICSIAGKDLLGRTVPKTRRGRLSGAAASFSGVVAVAVGIVFATTGGEEISVPTFVGLLGFAGSLWLIAAIIMATLDEKPAEVRGSDNSVMEMWKSFHLLRELRDFRTFCIARALLSGTVLSMPFYVLLAHEATSGRAAGLGLIMVAGSAATALSGLFWGRLADRSSRTTLVLAGSVAGAIGCIVAALPTAGMTETLAMVVYSALFFFLNVAHTGIRLGRKTYLVDMANADNRAALTAVSNTLIGAVLLAGGSLGFLADQFGARTIILIFAVLGLAGAVMAHRLPEVQEQ